MEIELRMPIFNGQELGPILPPEIALCLDVDLSAIWPGQYEVWDIVFYKNVL
jgi:hypothetical protein